MSSVVTYLTSLPLGVSAVALAVVTCLFTVSVVVPTTPLNIAAGIICNGSLTIDCFAFSVGATAGSWINFVLGRKYFNMWAKKKLQSSPKMLALETAISKRAFNMIVLSRLSPVFPFAILGYIIGVTKVNASTFTIATFIGLIPGVTLYAWIGMSMASASMADASSLSPYISIAIAVSSTALISWQAKRILDEATTRNIH